MASEPPTGSSVTQVKGRQARDTKPNGRTSYGRQVD